jgi:hypothetical protein
LPNFGFHHCDIPSLAGNIRGNVWYVDGAAGGGRVHFYCGFTNSVLPKLANKGDWFGVSNVPDASREPGYREFSYSVGNRGNYHASQFALSDPGFEIESFRQHGLNSLPGPLATGGVRSNGPFQSPGWLDNRQPTSIGGANGTTGGDYRHTFSMPAPSDADVLFDMLGLPVPVWIMLLFVLAAYVLLNHTRWGRILYMTGGNAEAATLSGVNVKKVKFTAFVVSGVFASMAGILFTARVGSQLMRLRPDWVTIISETLDVGGHEVRNPIGYLYSVNGIINESSDFFALDEVAHVTHGDEKLAGEARAVDRDHGRAVDRHRHPPEGCGAGGARQPCGSAHTGNLQHRRCHLDDGAHCRTRGALLV